jgi:chromatin remodeling complex protein RSC6
MWAYIKENKLQDPKNKQMIKCDEKLSKIIPTKKFRGFGMTKYLKDHMNVEGGKAKKSAARADSDDDSDAGSD